MKKLLFGLLVVLFFSPLVWAEPVTLEWDANIESDLAGYKIYYKTGSSGEPYDGTGAIEGNSPVDVGNVTTFTLNGLTEGDTYYFVATAYNTGALESDYSNEVTKQIDDVIPPGAPTVSGATPTNDTTPTWSWSSGDGGNGTYRYKLDDSDLTSGATQTTSTSHTPTVALSEGSHTLYVQERDDAGNWSNSGSFTIVIDILPPQAPSNLIIVEESEEIFLDNGEDGTSYTGTWQVSSATDPYGDDSLWSNEGTYTFEIILSGSYEVSLWWSQHNNRCSNVSMQIYDGDILLSAFDINQLENGGQWNILGTYIFNDIAKIVIIAEDDSCSACADAVKFSPVQ
jgi:hypothetical protein